jgi:ABC-2 type transport system permease protein
MKFSLIRALIIARREYVTTVKRKGFVFSLLLTPALMFLSVMLTMAGSDDARKHAAQERIVAFVDSSGVFANAPLRYDYVSPTAAAVTRGDEGGHRGLRHTLAGGGTRIPVVARRFASQKAALDSLDAGTVNTVLVIAPDYLRSGTIRRYEHDTRALTESGDDRALRTWLTVTLVSPAVDSAHVARAISLTRATDLYAPDRTGQYLLKDDMREIWSFILPFALALLLGMAIVMGGQYLLQGVAEEKETRILESLLCTVSPDDLMLGKLLGLGSAGLTLVGVWLVFGLQAAAAPMAMLHVEVSPLLIVLGVAYFLFGYLFYASLMTGIGAIANNLREAQQLAMVFTMMNFIPFYALTKILNSPDSKITLFMSLFPLTAPTTMMMRLSVSSVTGTAVPAWQIAASLGLLAVTSLLALKLSAKLFRLGLLLYGKTPNLPEIIKIMRRG